MINALKRLFRKPEQGPIDEGNEYHEYEMVPRGKYAVLLCELTFHKEMCLHLKAKLSRSHQKRDAKGRFVRG